MFRIVPILLFILVLAPFSSWAQNNVAYTVNDVKVDILAETSVKARDQAFSAAQAQGFKMLAARFLSPEDLANFTPPDADAIAGMVSDFEITSEQMSKRRYLGTYLFRFKIAPVNRYFGHGPTGNVPDAADDKKLLVLPYFSQKNGKAYDNTLWDIKKNPWLEAWQKQRTDSDKLIIPEGDVSDTMDIRDADAESLTQSAIKRLRARYNADDIVIANAIFDQSATDILVIKLYRTDTGSVQEIRSFSVPKGDATKLGELLGVAVPQIKTVLEGNWKNQADYDPTPAASVTNGTPAAATASPQGSSYTPQAGQIKVTARFSSINDWLAIRRSLNDIPPLKSLLITSLATNQASMEFTYSDWMALTSSLSARGLVLQPSGTSEYILIKSSPAGYTR